MKQYTDQGKVDTRSGFGAGLASVVPCVAVLLLLINSCSLIYTQPDDYRFCRVEFTLNGEHYEMDSYSKDRGYGLFSGRDYDIGISVAPMPSDSSHLISFNCDINTEDGLYVMMDLMVYNQDCFINNERYYNPIIESGQIYFKTPAIRTGSIYATSISYFSYGFQLIEDGHDAYMFVFDIDYTDRESQELMEIRNGKIIVSDYLASRISYKKYIKDPG